MTDIVFDVRGEQLPVPEPQATIIAEDLRRLPPDGNPNAIALADTIELVLVGEHPGPITITEDTALPLYRNLDVALNTKPDAPQAFALYHAARAWLVELGQVG